MSGIHLRSLLVALVLSGTTLHPVRAEPVVTGSGAAGDPIIIVLDTSVSGDLAVEIDGVDMTGLIQRNGNTLTIAPVPPLPGGPHEVILYSIAADSFDIVVEWQIDDGRRTVVDSASVIATHEAGVTTGSAGTQATAESVGDAEIVMFDQRLKAGAHYLATTIEENEIDGRPVNLGEYYLEFTQPTDSMDITARLGHQTIDFDDLVVADLYKRGAGLSFERLDQRAMFAFFGTQSADGLGIDNFTGLGVTDDRMFGATLAVQPFAQTDLTLALTGYSGRGEEFDGAGFGAGDAYSLSLSGSARDGRLRYGLGAGISRWDEDAEGAAFDRLDAAAFAANLEYDVLADDGFDSDTGGRNLTVGLGFQRVDHDYFSLANAGLAPSQQTVSLTADYFTDATSLSGYLDHQTTNVNGPDDLETDRIITAGISGSRILFSDGNGPGWAGLDPQLGFALDLTIQDRLETPPLATPPLDQTSIYATADFSTSYETWSWSLGYGLDWFNDESATDDDSIGHGLTFGVDFFPTDRLTYGLTGNVFSVSDLSGSYVDGNIGVTAAYEILPAELVLAGDYQMDFSTDDFGLNGGTLGADLTWSFSAAADLELSAGLAHGDSAIVDDTDWFVGALLRFKTNYIR